MEGKGTPKNEQNQFCHSPSVKAVTPSEVERQDSHAAGVKYSLRDLSPSLMQFVKMECRGSPASASGAASTTCVRWRARRCLQKSSGGAEWSPHVASNEVKNGCVVNFRSSKGLHK